MHDQAAVLDYTEAALDGDRRRAIGLAGRFAAERGTLAPVVLDLLAPSQRLVGERWRSDRCTVGAEHAATFVTENVLAALALGIDPGPAESATATGPRRSPGTRGTFVMVCAEGEWHGLASRMATELLIADGWHVIDLGPATPAEQLRAYLAGAEVDVVGVSVSMTTNLHGAARTVDAAGRLGLPVVCGGSAFDRAGTRARAIGATGQCLDLSDPFDLDRASWDPPAPVELDDAWSYLDAERDHVVGATLRRVLGPVDRAGANVRSTWANHLAAELDLLLDALVSAVLCDDATIAFDHVAWLRGRDASNVPDASTPDRWIAAMAEVVDGIVPDAAAILVAASGRP